VLTIKRIMTLVGFLVTLFFAALAATGGNLESKITAQDLGGDKRYLMYVSTDKPVYREEESVYLRAVFLNAADNTPVKSSVNFSVTNSQIGINVRIRGPKGESVFQGYAADDNSTAGIKWDIPSGTAGGQYTALVTSPVMGIPETERSFEIRAYRAPRLKTQIEFTREGYGPGDLVQASIKVDRAEGGVPEGAKITVLARVDGTEVYKQSENLISADGTFSIEFNLPKTIAVGDGSLSFIIEDGGVVETASKTLPILLQTMDITFYPEGGDLIAGLASRVYVQAKRPDGKPADIVGRIVEIEDEKLGAIVTSNEVAAELMTQHEGRGIFTITPEAGKHYALVLDAPSGINRHFPLPIIKTDGTVIKSMQNTFDYDQKIIIHVASNGLNPMTIMTLHKREVLIDKVSGKPAINSSPAPIFLDVNVTLDAKDAEGVLIVTAWDAEGNPLAERLVYRKPKFAINIDIQASAGPFVPGAEVSLDILTTDENGKPVEAMVGLTVTDDAVLEIIEKRDQAPRLPVMVYLENEVHDLADAHIYLDTKNQQAPQALDLLLGTQGWRRFILVRYNDMLQSYPEHGRRALAERQPEEIHPQAVVMQRILENVLFAAAPLVDEIAGVDETQEAKAIVENAEPEKKIARNEANIEAGDFYLVPKLQEEPQRILADADIAMKVLMRRPTLTIREYAYQVRPNRKANDRVDFTETLYWHKGIRTGARDGKATVSFGLSDSVTTFRVLGGAFGHNGALGSNDIVINSVEPFYIEPKMPLEATVGDIIELPVSLVNASNEDISSANLLVKSEGVSITQAKPISLTAGERARRVVRIVATKPGSFPLSLTAAAGPYVDSVTRTLTIKPKGFPISINHGGLLGSKNNFNTRLVIPKEMEPGSLASLVKVYPSPLANMEEALNALLRQPNGCFEQTSSSNYPLVMAQQYFTSHQGVSPEKIAKAKKLLNDGYQKLIGFESEDKGYEWFGANPAHEALTAYGLMEFVDMAKVMPVDEAMIKRTRDWLLLRRDGKGGFQRNEKALDSFGRAPAPTTNAYIVWSLLESGEKPELLKKEIAAIKKQALKTDDNYIVSLAANILYLSKDNKGAATLSKKLAAVVNKEGAISGAVTSITQSGGDALMIETTSLTLLAWLKDDAQWAAQVEVSMKWLFERSQSGRFGSTQSTILALKAINAYDAARAKPKNPGSVQLFVNGQPFGKAVAFNKDSKGAIALPDISAALTPGEHHLALKMQDGSKMPFAFEVTYNTSLPERSEAAQIKLETRLSDTEINEGEPLEMEAVITVGDKNAPTPIAIIGIPAGLEVRHDQLKELVSADRISAYEVIGREVILYWRALKAGEKRIIPISLIAAIPGTYTGPASRAYLYYTDEHKHWEKGASVIVRAR
jgi:hypothetical protein